MILLLFRGLGTFDDYLGGLKELGIANYVMSARDFIIRCDVYLPLVLTTCATLFTIFAAQEPVDDA